ncbi:hypothetical protein Goklo_016237 [Gossypium klotzschianum]|uniref:DUF4283 domain-containing protein n=1 Tax=Gossypium klotzschianum TaxID=34286 RepID=A0A7J8UDH1_9ROSI|nr:hypothetical protein [Gossypium klotzschianum]
MGEEFARVSISNDKEVLMQNQGDEDAVDEDFRLCLVGRVLTHSVVHFPSMRNILTNLWHSLGGVSIMDIGGCNEDPQLECPWAEATVDD